MNTFHLVVASVGETLFDGMATAVTLPTAMGEQTILPHHEPLITTISAGKISVRTPNETKIFNVKDGVVECTELRVVIML